MLSNTSKPQYSLIIPVYNSAKILPILLEQIKKNLKLYLSDMEVIMIDDGSKDDSWQVLENFAQKADFAFLRIIRLSKNFGQFMATTCGINVAKGDVLITMDDDLQFKTADLPAFIDFFENSMFYFVYGIRNIRKHSKVNNFFTKIALFYLFKILLQQKREIEVLSSLRIFSRKILPKNKYQQQLLHIDIDAYCNLHLSPQHIGFQIVEHKKRKNSSSGYSFFAKVALFFQLTMRYVSSPLKINLYVAVFLFLCSPFLLFCSPFVSEKIFYLLSLISYSLVLLSASIIGVYLAKIYQKAHHYQTYVIIEDKQYEH